MLGVSGTKQLNNEVGEKVVLLPQKELTQKSKKTLTPAKKDNDNAKQENSVEIKEEVSVNEKNSEEINSEVIENARNSFSSVEKSVKLLYEKYFNKKQDFKPTYKEVMGDLLAFLSAKAKKLGVQNAFEKAFNLSLLNVSEKYYIDSYYPFVFKLTVWLDKKLNTEYSVNIFNDVLGVLFSLTKSDVDDLEISTALKGITALLESEELL